MYICFQQSAQNRAEKKKVASSALFAMPPIATGIYSMYTKSDKFSIGDYVSFRNYNRTQTL
jgi:hypothetical protein